MELTNLKFKKSYLEKIFEGFFLLIALWLLVQCLFQNYFEFSSKTIKAIDWFVWLFLLLEVSTLSLLAIDKKKYFFNNWLNVSILLIYFPILIWFHTSAAIYLRFLRLLVWLRFAPAAYRILKEIFLFNRIGVTLIIAVSLTLASGVVMSRIDPSINSIGDGMWWAWETITTVGYGDEAPSTLVGRLLAIVVMICGAALFSVITASLSAFIIKKHKKNQEELAEQRQIIQSLAELKKQLENIELRLNKQ